MTQNERKKSESGKETAHKPLMGAMGWRSTDTHPLLCMEVELACVDDDEEEEEWGSSVGDESLVSSSTSISQSVVSAGVLGVDATRDCS